MSHSQQAHANTDQKRAKCETLNLLNLNFNLTIIFFSVLILYQPGIRIADIANEENKILKVRRLK